MKNTIDNPRKKLQELKKRERECMKKKQRDIISNEIMDVLKLNSAFYWEHKQQYIPK